MIGQRHTKYRNTYRRGIVPISSTVPPRAVSLSPNIGQASDVYQSLIPDTEREQIDGAVFALSGERLENSLAVSAGHDHDTEKTLLTWRQLCAWPLVSDEDNTPDAASIFSTDSETVICLGAVEVPSAADKITARAKVTFPVGAGVCDGLAITVELFADSDTTLSSPVSALLYFDFDTGVTEEFRETIALDISGLSFASEKILLARASFEFLGVSSGTPEAAFYELQLGIGA